MLFGFLNNPMEWMVIGLIALLFFGNRLPSVMRSLGKGVTEFKKGLEGAGDDEELDRPRKPADKAVAHDESVTPAKEPEAVKDPANKTT